MLVCNVSLPARHASIAVGVVETAAALDALGTGNVVFATLVDDPASVGDRVDAYLGEIMVEAASASSAVNAGLVYALTISEAVAAADTSAASVPVPLSAAISETAAADSAQDAAVAAAARSAMLPGVFINSGTARQAYVEGAMANL